MESYYKNTKNIHLLMFSDKNFRLSAKRLVRQVKNLDFLKKFILETILILIMILNLNINIP